MSIKAEENTGRGKVIILDVPRPEPPQRSNPDVPVISIDPDKLGGTPTIADFRLPVTTLIDYIMGSSVVKEFSAEYGIPEGDVEAVLLKIRDALDEGWLAERVSDEHPA